MLDLYGDQLEALEFSMLSAGGPGVQVPEMDRDVEGAMRTSFKLKRRVSSLRRYAWNARQLLQELRQNNFGVMSNESITRLHSVQVRGTLAIEVYPLLDH